MLPDPDEVGVHQVTNKHGNIGQKASFLLGTPLYDPLRAVYHAMVNSAGSKVFNAIQSWYAPFLTRGDLAFDIGANRGEHTAAILGLGVRVVAVEPNEVCASRLRRRFWGRTVSVVQSAVGAERGEAILHLGESDTLSTLSTDWLQRRQAHGRFQSEKSAGEVRVPVVTMSDLIAEHGMPSFVKIDVEGFEEHVLRGMAVMPPALCFEFNSESLETTLHCLDILTERGATAFCIRKGIGTDSAPVHWHSRDEVENMLTSAVAEGIGRYGDVFAVRQVPSFVKTGQRT